MLDVLLTGGQLAAGASVYQGNIGIKNGKIVEICHSDIRPQASRTIDATGKIIIPGVIDVHVHTRETISFITDTMETITTAAAYGGVTTIMPFRWTARAGKEMAKGDIVHPVPDTAGINAAEFLQNSIEKDRQSSVVDFSPHWGLLANESLIRQIPEVRKLGITSFKMIQGYPPTRGWSLGSDLVLLAMELIAENGGIAMYHAENGPVSGYLEDKFVAKGVYDAEHYIEARPSLSEAEATYSAICLSKIAHCPLYLVHVTSKVALENIARAKTEGSDVTAETCPPYLLMTRDDQIKGGKLFKTSPPLKLPEDVDALWLGIKNGSISVISTDHVGWDRDSLKLAAPSYRETPNNFPGVETLLPLIYSEGVVKGRITLPQMVKILCENPAKVFGLHPRKGSIAIGADADLVIIDPTIEWEIKAEDLHAAARYDAYEGWRMKGKPILSLLRGEILLQNGKLHKSPGFGQFIPRDSVLKE